MGEIIRLVSKSEPERIGLIREARAKYDSVFPPTDPVSEQPDKGLQLMGQWRQCSTQRGFLVIKQRNVVDTLAYAFATIC